MVYPRQDALIFYDVMIDSKAAASREFEGTRADEYIKAKSLGMGLPRPQKEGKGD